MAGSFSDYAENKVLEHVVGKTSFTMPTVYLALVKASIGDSATGTSIAANEPSGAAGYARVAISGSTWGSASGGSITNANAEIVFNTATGLWGTVVSVALVDASSGGNVLFWADLSTSKTIDVGDTLKFPVNSLTLTLD